MEGVLEGALFSLVGGAALALGGTPRALHGPLWGAGLALLVFLGLRAAARVAPGRPIVGGPLLLPGSILLGWVALQLVPVFGRPPRSLSPPDTARGLAFLTLALVVHAAAATLFQGRAQRRRLPRWLAGIGLAIALVGLFQRVSGTTLIYGRFVPEPGGIPFGPFWYRNHFAACLVLTLPAAFHLALGSAQAQRHGLPTQGSVRLVLARLLGRVTPQTLEWTAVTLVLLAALFSSASRGGLLALVVGGVAAATVARPDRRRLSASLALVLLVPFLWLGLGPLAARMGSAPADVSGRFMVWKASWTLARDHWPLGAGFNAYPAALAARPELHRQLSEAHALNARASHNDYLQVAVETGLPGLALALWASVAAVRAARAEAWRLASVVGLLVHAAVDFQLQVPGVALLFCTVTSGTGTTRAYGAGAPVRVEAPR